MKQFITDLITFYKNVFPLKEMPRIGWIREGLPQNSSDTIASHSFMVCALSDIVSEQFNSTKKFGSIDTNKTRRMAIYHDVAESLTGDIDIYFKTILIRNGNKEVLDKLEQEAMFHILGNSIQFDSIKIIVNEYKEGLSKEAKVVRFCDVIDAFAFAKIVMRREYKQYFDHSVKLLLKGSPENDDGFGCELVEMLNYATKNWEKIIKTTFIET